MVLTIYRAPDGGEGAESDDKAEYAAEQEHPETDTGRRQVDSRGPARSCSVKSGASSGHRRRPSAEWGRWTLYFKAEEDYRRDRDVEGTEVASAVAMAIAVSILAGIFVIAG